MPYVTSIERLALRRGREEGLLQGLEQGKLEGPAAVLLRQLQRRFGPLPSSQQRLLQSATQAQLDLWADRGLDAESLSEIFQETGRSD
ncbi:MAG: DUF4351 domain-containing protein [bacterium]